MAKRLTEKEKKELNICFTKGESIEDLAEKFECTKLTISRNLKKIIGENKYKELVIYNKLLSQSIRDKNKKFFYKKEKELNSTNIDEKYSEENKPEDNFLEEIFPVTPFLEITPLNCEIENSSQRDFSSITISDIDFPKIVYIVVDKSIELDIKYLKDFPDWQFLSQDELNRKTIEIFADLKIAKRNCNKDQKVIKVPNTNVFKIVAPILVNRGISRIVSDDKLIAL